MDAAIGLSRHFKTRMLGLALLTGFLIAITLPVTYLVLSLYNDREASFARSQQVAWKIHEFVKAEPENWQNPARQYLSSLLDYTQDIAYIELLDGNRNQIDKVTENTPYFVDIRQEAQIRNGTTVYGYVLVGIDTNAAFYNAVLLLLFFAALGFVVGNILYRYPLKIVLRGEEQISVAFKQLNYLSYFDNLTGLPNRNLLLDQLTRVTEEVETSGSMAAVIFLDLDRFKLINDTLGHNEGDVLLKVVAQRLVRCIGEPNLIGRLGGDEFLIIIPNIGHPDEAAAVANALLEAMIEPFLIDGQELYVTASAGISIYPSDGQDIQTLVKNADAALYRAKEQGKNKFQFYTGLMNTEVAEQLSLANSLRRALKNEEFAVYYQPVVDLGSGLITGMEALVRWQHPEQGLILPGRFIPAAEETGLIVPLGEWVMRTACAQNKAWQDAGYDAVYMAVNLSSCQFLQRNLVYSLKEILQETGLPPEYLQLEITESVAMYNEGRVMNSLKALDSMGVRLAIDDFGTGYSSLSRLKDYPFSTLKIDKEFVHNLAIDPRDLAITEYIIKIARTLKLTVVAEGVESEEQLAFLRECGCDAIQGYLFSRPLPADAVQELLLRRQEAVSQ